MPDLIKWVKAGTVVVVLACLYGFVRNTDLQQVEHSLQQVGWRFIYLPAITCFAYLLATVGWQYCMEAPLKRVSIADLFLIRHIGETFGTINPTSVAGGDALKVYLLKKRGVATEQTALSVVVSRILMILTQLLLFLLAAGGLWIMLPHPGFQVSLKAGMYSLFWLGTGCGLLLLWRYRSPLLPAWKQAPKGPIMFTLYRLGGQLQQWKTGFRLFWQARPGAVFRASLFFAAHWLAGALEFYCILRLLHTDVSVTQALLIDMGVIFFKAAGAFVPGQIGVEEYGNKVMLAIAGITDTEIWITASLLRRTRQLFWIAFGLAAYAILYRKQLETPATSNNGNSLCQS